MRHWHLAFLLTFALSFVGRAQSPLSKVETRVRLGWKAQLEVHLTSSAHVKAVGSEAWVTGTNVNMLVKGWFPPVTSEDPPGGPWPNGEIEFLELKIDGNLIKRWTPGQVPSEQHAVRFASTKFSDGASKDITLEGNFKVWDNETPPNEDSVPCTATLPVKIHNKLISLATVEIFFDLGNPPHYSKPGMAITRTLHLSPKWPSVPPTRQLPHLQVQS